MDLTIVVIVALVIVAGALYWFNRNTGADVDQDGDVDLQDAKLAVEKTVEGVKEVAVETVVAVKETVKKATKKSVDLTSMKKAELLAHAKSVGAKANASMNKQEIIDAINGK